MDIVSLIVMFGGFVGGLLIAIIGFFLKRTMNDMDRVVDDLVKVRNEVYINKSRMDVMEKEYILKHEHLGEKFDELHDAVKDLIIEIKSLTQELHKKKD